MVERTQSRTKSIGVRVTEIDFARLQALAGAQSKPLSEWCRDVLLEWAGSQSPSPAERTLLAEVLALRTILLNLFFKLASAERITEDEMRQIIELAEADKLKKAHLRIQETEKSLSQGGKK